MALAFHESAGYEKSREVGNNIILHDPLPEKFKCPLCKKLMKDPVQTIRGELACESCYMQVFSNNDGKCPVDGEIITLNQVHKDKYVAAEINALLCICKNSTFGCSWEGNVSSLQDHISACSFHPEKCYFCENVITTKNMGQHFRICSGMNERTDCFHSKAGCSYKPTNAKDLLKHMQEDTVLHEIIHENFMNDFSEQNTTLQRKFEEQKRSWENTARSFQQQMQMVQDQLSQLKQDITELRMLVDRSGTDHEASHLDKNNNVVSSSGSTLNTGNISALNVELEVNKKELQILSTNVGKINNSLSELHLRQQLSENASYEGYIIWKIDNFKVRYMQAITGRITALHSAPGFTSKYGYKFCARLYLNGDGMGKCTHTSLFLVVMKSEYDNLLQWPFNRRVTFKLMNQEDQSKNAVEAFYPDSNSSSFQKPIKEMNVAAGCPMFLPKKEFLHGGFIKDDCLFIKVDVT